MGNIAADPLRDREIHFSFKNKKYKARFRGKGVIGWTIFDGHGIVCPEHKMPALWAFFKEKHEPQEIKGLIRFFGSTMSAGQGLDMTMIKGKEKVTLAYLYGKMLDDELTDEERMLVCRVLKTIALFPTHKIVFSETMYVDIEEQMTPESF